MEWRLVVSLVLGLSLLRVAQALNVSFDGRSFMLDGKRCALSPLISPHPISAFGTFIQYPLPLNHLSLPL
jgi:hypothetical protein